MQIQDVMITSLETITAFDVVTGQYLFTLDELQDATIENTQDTEEITGRGGRRLAQLKRNKAVTVSGTNGMVSGGLLAAQTGTKIENKATKVLWTDYATVKSGAASTTYIAVGTAGAEIKELYIRNADGTLGDQLEQDAEVSKGKFTYNPETKALAFNSDVTDGTEIVIYYERRITANVLANESAIFSTKAAIYIDAMAEDKCANIYRVQFFIPKADFSGEFSLEMGDSQTTHEFEAESLAGACISGNADALWTYTVFGQNAPDASDDSES